MLSHKDIESAIKDGDIRITPGYKIQPCSIDLDVMYEANILRPGSATTARTTSTVEISTGYSGLLIPRSRTFRSGLITQGCGLVDPGYRGRLAVTIFNAGENAVELYKHPSPMQLVLFELSSQAVVPYGDVLWGSNWMES